MAGTMLSVLVLVFLLQQVKCELLVNIALHRTPTQNAELPYPDAKIVSTVDGNKNCLTENEFTGTTPLLDPWWQLDLGDVYIIPVVHVFGRSRTDTLSDYLVGFQLRAGFTEEQLSLVYRNNDTVYNDGDIWINTTIIAKIIRINLPNYTVSKNNANVSLFLCEVEIYTLTNEHIKQYSNVSMSTVYSALNTTFGSDLAIDGIYPTSEAPIPELCKCCSITGSEISEENLWWTIDFGQRRMIGGFYITGRRDAVNQYQSKNTRIYINNADPTLAEEELGEVVLYINISADGYIFQHTFQEPRLFQFMSIIRPYHFPHFLTICEVDFITPVCPSGHYGINCLECQPGHYGLNCSEACGYCRDPTTCLVTDGTCPDGCATGYNFTDRMCKTECQPGSYGLNCSETCGSCTGGSTNCFFIGGTCPNDCASGYDYGADRTCKTACKDGMFGFRCNDTCGNCSGTSTCNKTDGTCPSGCAQWLDYNADKTCKTKKPCPPNTYTVYCIPCGHCYAGLPCDGITGRCPNGCETGYSSDTCNQAINTGTCYGTKDVIGAAIGGTIGGAIFILFIGMLVQRRNKLRCPWVCQTTPVYESPKPRENTDDQNMYDVLDITDLSNQSVSGSMQCTEEVNPATPHYQNTHI